MFGGFGREGEGRNRRCKNAEVVQTLNPEPQTSGDAEAVQHFTRGRVIVCVYEKEREREREKEG